MVRLISLLLGLLFMVPATASDIANGKSLSRQCSVCHGKDGLSMDPEVPNLAGLSALYIEKTLSDYKNGARQDRRKSLIAQNLSKSEIKDLAAWYSAFQITVEVPEL